MALPDARHVMLRHGNELSQQLCYKEINERRALISIFTRWQKQLNQKVSWACREEDIQQSGILEEAAACRNKYIAHIAVLLPGLLILSPKRLRTGLLDFHSLTHSLLQEQQNPNSVYAWIFHCPGHDWSWMPQEIVAALRSEWEIEPLLFRHQLRAVSH